MAQVQLTDRQKDIKARLDKGETPEKVGKALKITTNAVYQQIRRMRKAGVKVGGTTQTGSSGRSASTGNSRTQARKAGAKGGKKTAAKAKAAAKPSTPRRQSARTSAPKAPAAPVTAEQLLRDEIGDLRARAEMERTRVKEAEAVIAEANAAVEGIEAEAAKREDVLAVLTGDKVAHAKPAAAKPAAAKKAGAKRGSAKPAEAAQEAPQEPQAAQEQPEATSETTAPASAPEAAPETPAATNGSGPSTETPEPSTQAEREATGDFDPFAVGGEGEGAEAEAAQAAAEEPQTA